MVNCASSSAQIGLAALTAAVGVGWIVMVNCTAIPSEPGQLVEGVTVMVATSGVVLLGLLAVNPGNCPLPPAAKPMLVLLLVQE